MELLVAMALVVFIMTVLSHALVRGLEVLHRLAPQGELEERLRDALALDAEVEAADRQAWKFIQEARRTGTVDWDQAAALREQYETICASAERLEARLREAELHLEKPAAQLALQRSLNTLDGLKLSAALMVELLRAVESGDLRPS